FGIAADRSPRQSHLVGGKMVPPGTLRHNECGACPQAAGRRLQKLRPPGAVENRLEQHLLCITTTDSHRFPSVASSMNAPFPVRLSPCGAPHYRWYTSSVLGDAGSKPVITHFD